MPKQGIKITVIVFNVALIVLLLSGGIYAAVKDGSKQMIIALTVSAFLVSVIPLLGLLGAFLENRCLLVTYIVFLTLGTCIKVIVCSYFLTAATHKEAKNDFMIQFGEAEPKNSIKRNEVYVNRYNEWRNENKECCGCKASWKPERRNTTSDGSPCPSGKKDCCEMYVEEWFGFVIKASAIVMGSMIFDLAIIFLVCIFYQILTKEEHEVVESGPVFPPAEMPPHPMETGGNLKEPHPGMHPPSPPHHPGMHPPPPPHPGMHPPPPSPHLPPGMQPPPMHPM